VRLIGRFFRPVPNKLYLCSFISFTSGEFTELVNYESSSLMGRDIPKEAPASTPCVYIYD